MANKRYASGTNVGTDKSIGEIRSTLRRFGATGFGYVEQQGEAIIAFEKDGRHYRFVAHLPERESFRYVRTNQYGSIRERAGNQIDAAWEQGIAEKWRALALSIKGIVVAIDEEILTFEQVFFSHLVVPGSDRVLYDVMQPQIDAAYQGAHQPLMLIGPPAPPPVATQPAGPSTTRIQEVDWSDDT